MTASEPTHACLRCGTAIPLADALCRSCNPAGLKQPAASQAHGTVFAAIALAVVGLAVAAFLLVGGVGPFRAGLDAVAVEGDGLRITVSVANDGAREGSANCRVWDSSWLGNPPRETFIRTPVVPAGGTITFDQTIAALGTRAGAPAIDCSR